jgi:multiple sugar transport system substrate-binding protein
MFKKLGIGVFALFIMVALASSSTTFAAKTITFWHYRTTPMEGAAEQELIDAFNKTHPDIQIKAVGIPEGIVDKARTAIAGGKPPDVTDLWTWTIPEWGAAGMLMPLDEYAKDFPWEEYWPVVKDLSIYDGHVYGLSWSLNSWLLHYNIDVMEEVGLDPNKPPLTIAELDAYAEKLTKVKADGTIERLGFAPWIPGPWWIFTWGYVFGGEFYDEANKKITANDPKIMKELEWELDSYVNKYGMQKLSDFATSALQAGGYPGSTIAEGPTYTGKIAMWYFGQWALKNQARYSKIKFGLTPLPYPPGGREKCTFTEGNAYLIPTGAKNPDEAWVFIRWAMEKQQVLDLAAGTGGSTPTHIEAAHSKEFLEGMAPGFVNFVDILGSPNVKKAPFTPVTILYQNELSAAYDAVRWGKKTPQQAMDDVTAKVQKELDRALKGK